MKKLSHCPLQNEVSYMCNVKRVRVAGYSYRDLQRLPTKSQPSKLGSIIEFPLDIRLQIYYHCLVHPYPIPISGLCLSRLAPARILSVRRRNILRLKPTTKLWKRFTNITHSNFPYGITQLTLSIRQREALKCLASGTWNWLLVILVSQPTVGLFPQNTYTAGT